MSINLSCHSKEHPKGTCFAARSDVGIRNLLVANSQESVKIVRFGSRLPRQSADWLAMTGFFDSLCQREALTEGLSFPGGAEPSAPTHVYRKPLRHPCGRMWASAPTKSPTAYAPYARADRALAPLQPPIDSKNTFQNSGQRPPPTFAAARQRRDLIIAHPPGGCFQRGRAAALPLWSLKDGGFSRGKGSQPRLRRGKFKSWPTATPLLPGGRGDAGRGRVPSEAR